MKIQLASDLHLEFLQKRWPGERIIKPVPEADVLVLAGDIAKGANACKLFANWSPQKKVPIIYVAGNHEFYDQAMIPTIQKIREKAAQVGIHFLENDSVVIDGVRFLGATLWTDYRLRSQMSQAQLMEYCELRLNDHRLIMVHRQPMTAQYALSRHEASRDWLRTELAKPFEGKTVVVTHHGPHPLSVHPRYAGDPLNAGFVSDLSELMQDMDLWLHGHVHDSFDYQFGRCRVVTNPAGYVLNRRDVRCRENFEFENQSFDRKLLVETNESQAIYPKGRTFVPSAYSGNH